jgi:hypothetical protein
MAVTAFVSPGPVVSRTNARPLRDLVEVLCGNSGSNLMHNRKADKSAAKAVDQVHAATTGDKETVRVAKFL